MTRQKEIRTILKRRRRLFYKWLGVLAIISASIFIGAMFFNIGAMLFDDEAYNDYRLNFATEVMGVLASIGFTVFIIDRRHRENLKRRLVREAGSPSNDIALLAVGWLYDEGWLTGDGGLLQEADLQDANLQEANLRSANLQGAKLNAANLQRAKLREANLQGADLSDAKLQGVKLQQANLKKAKLYFARLESANLSEANLQGADMFRADLREAYLGKAELQGATMIGADLQGAGLYEANLQEANLIDVKSLKEVKGLRTANLEKANLSAANLQGMDLRNAKLRKAKLQMTDLQGVNFYGADLRETDLQGANLRGVWIRRREIRISIFSGEEPPVDSDEFGEVHPATALQGAILPNGERYTEETEIDKFIFPTHSEFSQTVKEINRFRKRAGLDDLPES